MDLIQGLIQQPKVQSADETIPTLCDRVENSTLINDRRSAVLGLKAFSRQYRESVIASGLKPLLNTLKRDYMDEDSVKAILETILILFIRGDGHDDLTRGWISQQSRLQNGKYPSPLVMKQEKEQVDQFSLWIADALTQSEDLIHLLVEFWEIDNFHIRLYTIQLLEAMMATRPLKARSALISLPTSISTMVSLLDDMHEPIRDEAILLLMAVVNDSPHVQKLVAFENIFERLFSIIEEEGGLRGSLVVNDCLSLINNILKYNTSNQTLFLETGNLPKLAHLLSEPISQDEGFFWNDQRIININTALDIVSLTVEPGNTVTSQHQNVLFDSSVLMVVLRLAFFHNIPKRVRPIALLTAANMIRSNEYAQLEFSKIDVPYFDPSLPTNATANDGPVKLVPVIDILINWMLYANSVHTFDTRVACSRLLKAYLMDSFDIQKDFLSHQEQLYNQPSTTNSHGAKENDISENVDEEESANEENISDTKGVSLLKANLFEVLLNYDTELNLNPFKLFFTTDIFMFLFQQEHKSSEELREITRNVTIGNNLDDEEPLKAIQTISELLTTSLTAADIRIPISYLTFLIYWLFGDSKATNDFLSDKSVIKSLLSFSYQIQDEDITIKCLVTMLLGVGYEFSSKESPFPRKEYFEFITKSLGKDNYASRIKQFKKDSFFSEIDQNEDSILTPELDETGLPRVYFSTYFIHLFNENMYRIRTALSHNPDEEPISKISFEEVEELQNQCAKLKSELGSLQAETKTTNEDLTEKLETLSKEHEELIEKYQSLTSSHVSLKENVSGLEIELKSITESLNEMTNSRDALETKDKENYFALQEYKGMIHKQEEAIRILEKELETISSQKKKAEDGINKMGKDLFALSREKQAVEEKQRSLQKEKDKSDSDHQKENKLLKDEITRKITEIKTLNGNLVKTKTQYSALSEEKEQTSKELVEYKSRFQSHDNLVTKLTEKLKSLANNYRDLQAKHELLMKSTEETKSESNTQLSNLQDEYDYLSREKENFQTEKDHLTDDIKELKETFSRLEHKNEETISKYNSEKDEYESQINQLREQLKSATTTQDDNVNKISELSKDIKNLETTLETCENSKHDLQTKLEASEKTLAEMHENEEHLKEEKNQLEKEVANTKKQLNTLRGNFESLESEHKDSISQVREYEKQITDKEKEYNKNISKLNDEIRAIQQENEALCQNNDNLKNEIEEVKQTLEEQLNLKESRMEALNFQIQDLKVKNQSSEAELSESVKNKEIETEKMIELQKECNSRKEKISELEEKLKTLEVRNSHNLELLKESEEAENELKEAKKELEIRTNEVKNQSEKIANLDKLNEKTGAELCRLKKTFTDKKRNLEEQLGKLRNEIKIKSQAFEKERKLLNEGSSTITQEYSEKINMLEDQLNKMENESESKTRLIDTSRSDLEKATLSHDEILEEKRNEINKMKDEILSYKEKINEANTKLLSTEQAHENGLNSLKEQLEAIQESKSEVERKLKDMEEKSAHLKSDLKKSKETAKDLKSDIENNEKRIELLVKSGKESDEKFKQYKEISQVDIKELQDEKTDLESQIVEFRKKIEELQVKLKDEAESNSKIETIQQELTNAYEKIRVNEEENVLLNSKLKNLECNLRDNQDEIQSTKEKNESLDSYLKDLKQELTDAQQKAKECEEKSKTEIEQLQAEASRSHEIAKQLELKYSNLATEEQTWKRNEEAIKKSTDSQKTEIEKLVEELERLNSENAQLKEANEDRSEIDDLMLLVTDLDEKNTKYRSKLEDLGVELSSEDDDEDEDDEDEEE
ncbi:hypothetical protein SEUBUCD650_0D01840 [Saccharomyces eubayanus]|uniref:USO1-like protein n=1 Tax=Saccharomyces eubayanus TaxID=1080349 RepID=A0ABN8VTG1_SACEU|nr:hypothetical protein SEUBUCD650_0D01840 [Saccharomyces eubayanus]